MGRCICKLFLSFLKGYQYFDGCLYSEKIKLWDGMNGDRVTRGTWNGGYWGAVEGLFLSLADSRNHVLRYCRPNHLILIA